MELLTSVLVAGGVCACIGAVKAVCRRLTKKMTGAVRLHKKKNPP